MKIKLLIISVVAGCLIKYHLDKQKKLQIRQQSELEEKRERECLMKMRDESVRKFKEEFPNGATIESGEFLC